MHVRVSMLALSLPEPEGIYRATWLPEVFSHDVFQQSSWRLAKDAPRELENAGTDTPRVFQGIDAIVLDEAHDCIAPMLDICACVLQMKQCSIDATGKFHFLGDNWQCQCEVLDAGFNCKRCA